MLERILKRMRDRIRTKEYVMTLHADEEMNDDGLSIFDVEEVILTGNITERQRDSNTAESKYVIQGQTLGDISTAVIAKLSPTGKLVIITVYRL